MKTILNTLLLFLLIFSVMTVELGSLDLIAMELAGLVILGFLRLYADEFHEFLTKPQ